MEIFFASRFSSGKAVTKAPTFFLSLSCADLRRNELISIHEILASLENSKHDYEEVLSISDDKDCQIHCKMPSNSCFVNNYFCDGLTAWKANVDIQPVFNLYKAVAYTCAHLSKSENKCSVAMKQAVRDAFEKDLNNYDQ